MCVRAGEGGAVDGQETREDVRTWYAGGRGWTLGQSRGAGEVARIEIMDIDFGGGPGGIC